MSIWRGEIDEVVGWLKTQQGSAESVFLEERKVRFLLRQCAFSVILEWQRYFLSNAPYDPCFSYGATHTSWLLTYSHMLLRYSANVINSSW
jgi:hypothetical protein